MRILGIDPGIGITGYSIIEAQDDCYELISCGSIQTDKNLPHQKRLAEIYHDIKHICKTFNPQSAAIEQLFFFKNQKTVIPVAQARGVILAALEVCGIEAGEYTPIVIKQTLTGHGRASKDEVKSMVERYVELNPNTKLDDTVDSIAIGICHARNLEIKNRESA